MVSKSKPTVIIYNGYSDTEILALADPTKPGLSKYYDTTALHRSIPTTRKRYLEADKREVGYAFGHGVSWEQFKQHLAELKVAGMDINEIERQQVPDSLYNDITWTNFTTIPEYAPVIASAAHLALKERKADLKRGDVIILQFAQPKSAGFYFYDGETVIPSDFHYSHDLARIPWTFKVPTEFPVDYWDIFTFDILSRTGQFCFDMSLVPKKLDVKKVQTGKVNKTETLWRDGRLIGDVYMAVVGETQNSYYLFFAVGCGEPVDKEVDRFIKTGRCHNWNSLYIYLELSLKERYMPSWLPKGVDVSRCFGIFQF